MGLTAKKLRTVKKALYIYNHTTFSPPEENKFSFDLVPLEMENHAAVSRRLVTALALSPLALGLCGFVAGLALILALGAPVDWHALGKVCLAGAVVSFVPVVWAALLQRTGSRR